MVQQPLDKVRQLQRRLFMAAKQSRGRRFHALYDRICRGDVMAEAWRRVRSNRGAAGVDGETLKAIEQRGVAEFLAELRRRYRSEVAALGEYLDRDLLTQWGYADL